MSFHAPTTTKICPDCNEEYAPGGYHQKRCDSCGYRRELSYHRNIKKLGVFSQCSELGCNRLVEGALKNKKRFCFEHGLIRWKASVRKTKRLFYQYHKDKSRSRNQTTILPGYRSRALQDLPTEKFLKVAEAIVKGKARIIPPPESLYALPIEVDAATDPKPYGTAEQNAWKPEYQTVKERVS